MSNNNNSYYPQPPYLENFLNSVFNSLNIMEQEYTQQQQQHPSSTHYTFNGQLTTYTTSSPSSSNPDVHMPRDLTQTFRFEFEGIRRGLSEELQRKTTISKGKKGYTFHDDAYHPQSTADCTVPNYDHQYALNPFESNHKNTHPPSNNNNDDGIRVYESSSSSSNQPPVQIQVDLSDDDSIHDEDTLFDDIQKELFDLLKQAEEEEECLTPDQHYILGYLYESGDRDDDKKQAIKYYTLASEQGHSAAMCNLGYLYEREGGYTKAISFYEKAAERGNAQAQYNLATLYERGLGVDKNIKRAVSLYEMAVEQKHHEALANLAYLYFEGKEVARDLEKASQYYHGAAEGGVLRAFSALDYLKHHKRETSESGNDRASRNLDISNNANSTNPGAISSVENMDTYYDAYFNIGDDYLGGIYKEKNADLAYHIYDMNRDTQKNGSIQRGLGMYYQYCGKDDDFMTGSFANYSMSASRGHTVSFYFLGVLFFQIGCFEVARDYFTMFIKQTGRPRHHVYYLFVMNEDEFTPERRPQAEFTMISEMELLMRAKNNLKRAKEGLRNEKALVNSLSR